MTKPHECPTCHGRKPAKLSCETCDGKGVVWEPGVTIESVTITDADGARLDLSTDSAVR